MTPRPLRSSGEELLILGIDPGVTGGWALLSQSMELAAGDLPAAGEGTQRMLSAPLLASVFLSLGEPTLAVCERVGAMPGQGVSSMFKFGRSVGVIEGVLGALNIPIMYVSPNVWKRAFSLAPEKEFSRQRAIELWPELASELFSRKKDHGRAEAALIALWGLRAEQAQVVA